MSAEKKTMDTAGLAEKIRELYRLTRELEKEYPGSRFTPDGHMVGSIGEVLAADHYGLTLLPNSAETHDATAPDGRKVQIKATHGCRVALSSKPQALIVLRIFETGEWEEVYNGGGALPWSAAGKMQKNGQCPISLSRLKKLMKSVSDFEKIPRIK